MTVRSFFDTNVWVYSVDKAAPAKQRRALELVSEHRRAATGVVSMQVLQEYFVTVTRKLQVDTRIARRKVELLAEFDAANAQCSGHPRGHRPSSLARLLFLGCSRTPLR
jgi:predicted nucleic acid-binding protein